MIENGRKALAQLQAENKQVIEKFMEDVGEIKVLFMNPIITDSNANRLLRAS